MKRCLFFVIVMLVVMVGVNSVFALDTGTLGGVANPSEAVLRAMDDANYILHARDGKLTQVPVHKVKLSRDVNVNPQGISALRDPSTGDIYVRTASKMHKSTDGGMTWSWYPQGSDAPDKWAWQILGDGTFVGIVITGKGEGDAVVISSADHGRSWKKTGITIARPRSFDAGGGSISYKRWGETIQMYRLGGSDTLIWSVGLSGGGRLNSVGVQYRSADGGKNWTGPTIITNETYCHPGPLPHYFSEGGMVELGSGNLLTAFRYQRKKFFTDPPATDERGYKNVFLLDSTDKGVTWKNLRQLTTAYGQTFGYPAALSDGTVVVIHDTRYGPGKPGARAMISYDEGKTWEDEVYYLDISVFSGSYSHSIVLEDDTILTISGTCDVANTWPATHDGTDIHAIRWKPVKKQAKPESQVAK